MKDDNLPEQDIPGRSSQIFKDILKSSRIPDIAGLTSANWTEDTATNKYLGLLYQLYTRQEPLQLDQDRIKSIVIDALKEAIKMNDLSKVNPANVQEVAASQLMMISGYYRSVLQQAQQSFLVALIATVLGLFCFISAASFLLFQALANISAISFVAGATVEIIAGINFYLYARASTQLARFHTRLDRTQNFLLANSVCENLEGEIKEKTRSELVRIIAGIASPLKDDQKG
jgi:hypothetical protein